jgi:hypothetical protein
VKGDEVYVFDVDGMPPVGAIIAIDLDFTDVPQDFADNWVECDGSTLDDPLSPLDGVVLPSLNSTNRYLRGNTTSGGTGGTSTHTHTGTTAAETAAQSYSIGSGRTHTGTHTHSYTTDSAATNPKYYDVLWYIRVK